MKKIVIATLQLAADMEATHYKPKDNFVKDYGKDVHYAINAFLPSVLKPEDEVKVVLIRTSGGANVLETNSQEFMKELEIANEGIGAKILSPVFVDTSFSLDNTTFKTTFVKLIKTLEQDAKIYVDCTYGHKANPFILTSVLQFAEKYFDCDIENMIYGKVEFDKEHKIIPEKSEMYDFISLYGMSSLTSNMKAPNGEIAVKAVEAFFEG